VKVFLTGASSGIGEALARHYAAGGATLGLVARRAQLLASLKAGIPACEAYVADVRDAAAMRAAAAAFIERHGLPDLVIANAGVSYGNDTAVPEDVEVFREILEINVLGLVNTFHPFIAPMRAVRSGHLVGIASVAGVRGLPGGTAYSASKAAAVRYLEGLRVELRGSGVDVTTISPGYIATAMTAKNPYRMPFIIGADDAARRFARAIERRQRHAVIPWPMAIVARLMALLPPVIYDALAAKAGRKPRKSAARD
jgi:short-subunit dehydrogenase